MAGWGPKFKDQPKMAFVPVTYHIGPYENACKSLNSPILSNIKSDLLRWLVTRSTNCAKAEEDLIDHHGQDMRTRLYSRLLKVALAAADLTNC